MVNNVYLALGSNLGDKLNYIYEALKMIKTDSKISVLDISSVYVTKAYGFTEQENFYNCVCKISTDYEPYELLRFCKDKEQKMGRIKSEKWGPRQIDIDILFYNNVVLNSDILTIPHKEFAKRDFFIFPMLEIAEYFVCPLNKEPIKWMYERLEEKYIIKKLNINTNEELSCLN